MPTQDIFATLPQAALDVTDVKSISPRIGCDLALEIPSALV
jgi:hypothetical protein